MELIPEEKKKIYEEEKARIEKEEAEKTGTARTASQLPQNVAGLLCYLAGWITGIIFLILEPDNRFIRFHAIQSIITFGSLMIISGLMGLIPVVGDFFSAVFGIIAFVLWIVLMIKAYQGMLYKLPLAGDVALAAMKPSDTGGESTPTGKPAPVRSEDEVVKRRSRENYTLGGRIGRVIGYSIAILWNIALLIFLSFFHKYIAWYTTEPDGSVSRLPVLTGEYMTWLPIFITVTVLSIAAYITLIIYDRYWFRETVEIVVNILGVVVIASLAYIFPFDFSAVPDPSAADALRIGLTSGLILIAVILAVVALVRFIKLLAYAARQ